MVFCGLISKCLINMIVMIPILLYLMTFLSYGKCRKMPFYSILRHLPYDLNVIKYSNMGIERTV